MRACACACERACTRTRPVVPELLRPNTALRKHQVRLRPEEGLQPSNPADPCSRTKVLRNGTIGPVTTQTGPFDLHPPPTTRGPHERTREDRQGRGVLPATGCFLPGRDVSVLSCSRKPRQVRDSPETAAPGHSEGLQDREAGTRFPAWTLSELHRPAGPPCGPRSSLPGA